MRLIDCREASTPWAIPRGAYDIEQALGVVSDICDDVRRQGIPALARYSQQFDRVVPDSFRVDPSRAERCYQQLDPDLVRALNLAIERRRVVCEAEVDEIARERTVDFGDGALVTIRSAPMRRAGIYAPGGLAPLASSVIMSHVPASVVGVESIALASPPQAQFGGMPHPTILAVAHMLGIKEIYAVGGAQAIAMFAYGVEGLCEPVDIVTGPGNIYVVASKRLVKGTVSIDTEAGPTEIAVLADDSANPIYVAADLLSQAEHDPQAGCVLITDSPVLAAQVSDRVESLLSSTSHSDRARAALQGEQSAILLVNDMEQGIHVANEYAAEHLEIHTRQPRSVASRIRNAGAIFVGPYSPVSLGDYCAGSTHVLPTRAAAKHSSGLTARSFLKTIHVIEYSEIALTQIGQRVERFAAAENLPAHADAIEVRLDS